jgi:hypothetical protein
MCSCKEAVEEEEEASWVDSQREEAVEEAVEEAAEEAEADPPPPRLCPPQQRLQLPPRTTTRARSLGVHRQSLTEVGTSQTTLSKRSNCTAQSIDFTQ